MRAGIEVRGRAKVIEPRLRLGGVVVRGVLYGLAAAPLAVQATRFIAERARLSFVAVAVELGLIGSSINLIFGSFLWRCCRGDVRRCRDWRTLVGRYDVVSIAAPVMVRLAASGAIPTSVLVWLLLTWPDTGVVRPLALLPWLRGLPGPGGS